MNLWTFELEAEISFYKEAKYFLKNTKKKVKLVMTKNKMILCINFQEKKSLFLD